MQSAVPDILFITRKWAPAVGGMETWSMRLSEELAKLAPVDIVALTGKANGHPPGALKLLGFPFVVLRHVLARSKTPNIMHLGDMALWPIALFAHRKTRIVLTAHGTDVSYARRRTLRGRIYGAYLRAGAWLLRGALVTANSPATEAAARETGWANITVIPLATDMTGAAAEVLPQPYLLFAGRLVQLKGCSWFIREVLPLLPEGLTLKVAGTGIDPVELSALDHRRVEYLGPLDQEALAEVCRTALCVIVPNIVPTNGGFEGFGLIAVEAAAAGGVVLAADCGGLPAAVRDGQTGFLIPPGDPQAWIRKIAEVEHWDTAPRHSFITSAQNTINQHYRWPRVARQTLTAYRAS
ncbi:MAG: glycosyltransferase family 4 protein [Novosphingobium sp.]